jgi:hypothetical protein
VNRGKKAADRIRADLPMLEVLADYGYAVHPNGGDREQSFSCDLHGDGRDSRPSAIYYPRTNSFHCFACSRSRDTVTLVMEKEGLTFWPAIRKIEKQYGLPPLPWEDDAESPDAPRPPTPGQQITSVLDGQGEVTWERASARVETFLRGLCEERTLDPAVAVRLWEAYDKVRFLHGEEKVKERDAAHLAMKVLAAAKEAAGGGAEGADG